MAVQSGLRGWSVLLAAAVLGVAVLQVALTQPGSAATFSTRFLGIFVEAVPFLLLGTVTAGFVSAFITPADIARWIPRNPVAGTVHIESAEAAASAGFGFGLVVMGLGGPK